MTRCAPKAKGLQYLHHCPLGFPVEQSTTTALCLQRLTVFTSLSLSTWVSLFSNSPRHPVSQNIYGIYITVHSGSLLSNSPRHPVSQNDLQYLHHCLLGFPVEQLTTIPCVPKDLQYLHHCPLGFPVEQLTTTPCVPKDLQYLRHCPLGFPVKQLTTTPCRRLPPKAARVLADWR